MGKAPGCFKKGEKRPGQGRPKGMFENRQITGSARVAGVSMEARSAPVDRAMSAQDRLRALMAAMSLSVSSLAAAVLRFCASSLASHMKSFAESL